MTVKKIKYTGFRNIDGQTVFFDKGINILYGNNAQGKTNVLEGIYLFAHGKSFRTQSDRDMMSFTKSKTALEMVYEDDDRKRELSFELYKTKRRSCKINKTPAKLNEIIGLFRAVLFCPDHLSIVKESPLVRRNFLNGAVCQIRPVYMKSLQRYNRILEERNALIKECEDDFKRHVGIIELYSKQLAKEATYIYLVRREYIKRLSKLSNEFLRSISQGEELVLKYKNSLKDEIFEKEEDIAKRYEELFMCDLEREIKLGSTLHGVHKDDIEIYLNGREAKIYASQGQQRSIALSLKLAEGEISKEETGKYPVFLFDDVLSELDKTRQSFVLDKLSDRQVIVTSCDISGFSDDIIKNAKLIYVENGIYSSGE